MFWDGRRGDGAGSDYAGVPILRTESEVHDPCEHDKHCGHDREEHLWSPAVAHPVGTHAQAKASESTAAGQMLIWPNSSSCTRATRPWRARVRHARKAAT